MDKDIKERWEAIDQGLVPKGYKKTKVGIIPEDWDVYSIKDFSRIDNKKYYPKKDQQIFKCIELEHIEKETGELLGFTNTDNVKSTKNMFSPGDVLYGKLRPYLKKYYYTKFKGVCSTEIWVLKNIAQKITAEYLYLIVQTPKWNYLANISIGSSMPRADWEYMESGLFPISSLEEQERIADILSTWDRAIESYGKLLEEKKERKKGLMQLLLTGEKRLGGFTGPWKEVRLGDVIEERNETGFEDYDLLAITMKDGVVKRETINIKDTSSSDKSKYKLIKPGDIGYNTMRMWQGVSGVSEYLGIVSPAYTILKISNFVDSNYLGYLFKLPLMINKFFRYSQGLVKDTLNLKYNNFKVIKITLPGLEEQKAIAEVLATADEEIELLEKLIEELEEEKKGLMQLLLKGIVRV